MNDQPRNNDRQVFFPQHAPEIVIPITRRGFLAAGGGMLAGGLLADCASAAANEKPHFEFALVSDNHLGRGGERESKSLATVVDEINATGARFTVFCGDLVNAGIKPENEGRYPEWKEISGKLAKPYYAVPGNHDPAEMFTKYISKETDFVFDHERFRFICFQDSRTDSHLGFVTREQIDWIQARIDEAVQRKQMVILVAHVIFHRNLHPDVGWWIRTGEKEFGELLKANQPTIRAFFAGHFHCGLRGWSDNFGVHEVILPSTSWNRDRGLQKAPGYALDEFRTGYVMVGVYDDRLVLRYKPLAAQANATRALPLV